MELATEALLGRAPNAFPIDAWGEFLQRVLVSAKPPRDPASATLTLGSVPPRQTPASEPCEGVPGGQ